MDLENFGFNKSESAVYQTLVKEGISTAHIISKISGVPYGKIYPVLGSLENKCFVKLFEGPPKKFIAVDPKIVFSEVIKNRKSEIEKLENQSIKIIESLGELSARNPKESLESIRIIQGYDNYLDLSISLHKKAENEWLSITELTIFKEHYDATKECIKRGVKVKLLTYFDEKNKKNIDLWKKIGAEIRFIDFIPTQFSVIDNKEVAVRILGEDNYLAVWIKNKSLAQHMRNSFNVLWKNAQK